MQTSRTNNKQVISTFKFGYARLTLKDGLKVKSEYIRRFLAHDFLKVGLTLHNSRNKNRHVISTFNFVCLSLTLHDRPKIKSELIRRFLSHDFRYISFTLQTSRTNNKGDTDTSKVCYLGYFGILWMNLNEGFQGQMSERLQGTHISVIHITYEEIQPSGYENQSVPKGR